MHVTGNPLGRPANVEVREGDDGYVAVDTGVQVDHAMVLLYGYDSECNAVGLNYDLSNYDHFRLKFEAVDLGTAGAIVVFTDGGYVSFPLGVPEGLKGVVDVPFARFTGDADWHRVQQIAIVIQSGGPVAAHDYALRSISAISCRVRRPGLPRRRGSRHSGGCVGHRPEKAVKDELNEMSHGDQRNTLIAALTGWGDCAIGRRATPSRRSNRA